VNAEDLRRLGESDHRFVTDVRHPHIIHPARTRVVDAYGVRVRERASELGPTITSPTHREAKWSECHD
jgi:hypothetical protein